MTDSPETLHESAWPEPAAPSAAVSAAIHQICTSNLRPIKSRSIVDRIVRSILLSGGLFAVLLALGWRLHPPQRAVAVALAGALVWGIAQASVIIVGLGRVPGKRSHRFIRWAVVFAVPMAFFS